MNMIIYELPTKDAVHRYKKSIVIPFNRKRRVLSTSPLNGGYQENLSAVFNNDCNPGAGIACTMKAPTYEEHMALLAEEIGLNPNEVAGLSTAASMENVAIHQATFQDVIVTAIVTGGIEVNGGRVGDPASWHEETGKAVLAKEGTINIILVVNTDLSKGALTRALVTCTEAKTAALQELLAGSHYSMGIATGSGTDGTIIVCDSSSDTCLTNAGKHSKLGELIGKAVIPAVKEALYKQTGLSPSYQHNVLRRLERFHITEDSLWDQYIKNNTNQTHKSRALFEDDLYQYSINDEQIVYVSLYAHILDQFQWGLLDCNEAVFAAKKIIALMLKKHSTEDKLIATHMEETLSMLINELKETILKSL